MNVSMETAAGRPTYKHESQRRGRGSGCTGHQPGSQTDYKKKPFKLRHGHTHLQGKGNTLTILV